MKKSLQQRMFLKCEMVAFIAVVHVFWAAQAAPPSVTYPSECTQNGGSVPCIPPDDPEPVRGEYIQGVNNYNGCSLVGGFSKEANNGHSSYFIDPSPPGASYMPPYIGVVNYCTNLPLINNSYYARLLWYFSSCRIGCWATATDSSLCAPRCTQDKIWSPELGMCIVIREIFRTNKRPGCGEVSGNPIITALGVKRQNIGLGLAVAGIELEIGYDSSPILFPRLASFPGGVNPYWRINLVRRVFKNSDGTAASAVRGDGSILTFVHSGGGFVSEGDVTERLVSDGSGFLLFSDREGLIEKYDADGALLSIGTKFGRKINFTYSDETTPLEIAGASGLLIEITDDADSSVRLKYEPVNGRLVSLSSGEDASAVVSLSHDGPGRLSGITFPDGSSKVLEYVDDAYPAALTGITHEDGASRSIYVYDAHGRARSTGMRGFALTTISLGGEPLVKTTEVYDSVTQVLTRTHEWSASLAASVSEPNGSTSQQTYRSVLGYPRLLSRSQPAGAGCSAATKYQELDENGNVTQSDNFNGIRSCYRYVPGRGLEEVKVAGLDITANCSSVTGIGAAVPAGARKTSAQWHPDWRMKTKVAEPHRITTLVYNGQPDPFDEGKLANCAPKSALLPDGKPIVVLCKQVEQATSDANGSLGFAAPLQQDVLVRIWQYSYNDHGQRLTVKDPLGHRTLHSYYTSSGDEYSHGDLASSTNALGQQVRYTRYNKARKLLQMVDANGVVTDYSYDLRQRLTSVTVAGEQTTRYYYWPTGLLKQVTHPDQSWVSYQYDGAHRLIGLSDKRGNRIDYSLDSAGNRVGEQVKDPQGLLARELTRVVDALNRVQQVTGRE